jgi:hypothetical protein
MDDKELPMKRLSLVFLLLSLGTGALLFAADEPSTLIDFTKLAADTTLKVKVGDGDMELPQNSSTLVDFRDVAGSSFSSEDLAAMKTSLYIANWEVRLNSSASSTGNQTLTYARVAKVGDKAAKFNNEDVAGKQILGARIHFPEAPHNAYAFIAPPFEIPAYNDKDKVQGDKLVVADADKGKGDKFDGMGVVKNVGIIKQVAVTVYGNNFPHGLSVVLLNQYGEEQQIFMDYLQFDGWRQLVWDNPNYVQEVAKREIKSFPLYPESTPFVKLLGFIVHRDAAQRGGDVIVYIKDVKVTYDKALLKVDRDIDDEGIWRILSERQADRQRAEIRRLGNKQVLRFIDAKKQYSGKDFGEE